MHDARPFLGSWELVPDLSRYEVGSPPKSATYHLEAEGDGIRFTIDWVGADDKPQHLVFTLRFEDTGDFGMSLVDARTLDTVVRRDGQVTAHARRVLDEEGRTLTVTQSGHSPDGRAFTNLSVYRRTQP